MTNEPTAAATTAAPLEAAPLAGFGSGAQAALPIGRRERQHGNLRTIADIHLTSVLEAVDDLAIADRVAWVIARRLDATCLVIATRETFLVATCDTQLNADDALAVTSVHPTDRIVTIATPEGLVPLLTPHTDT